jgi:hypothetical protein
MKVIFPFFLVVVAFSLFQVSSSASEPYITIASPDHPHIWWNLSGDKVSQYLEWNREEDQLVLHLAYADISQIAERNQSDIDTFDLSFPTVRLDSTGNSLYVLLDGNHKTTIGHLKAGIFGERVVLNNDFQLSAHRHDGIVRAAIISSNRSR